MLLTSRLHIELIVRKSWPRQIILAAMDDPSVPLSLRFGPFAFDEANARLLAEGQAIALAPKAFGVLTELLRHAGTLVTKDALLDGVWGHRHVSESVLKTTISELRAALGDDAKHPRWVETVWGAGYRLAEAGR